MSKALAYLQGRDDIDQATRSSLAALIGIDIGEAALEQSDPLTRIADALELISGGTCDHGNAVNFCVHWSCMDQRGTVKVHQYG